MWTISRALELSTSSLAREVASLVDYFADGEPSVPSSLTSTAVNCSLPGKTTVRLNRFRYGMTFAHSTGGTSRVPLTLSLVGFLAPRSPRSGSAPASTDRNPASGRRWPASSAKSARPGSSRRTPRTSSSSGSTSSYRTLTRSGTMRNGNVSPRPSSAPPTSATGFGYWGVPGRPIPEAERLDLFAQIDAQSGQRCITLPPKRFGFWPTPTYSDAKNSGSPSQLKRAYIPLSCRVRMCTDSTTGKITFNRDPPGRTNPQWLEWLMGFPRKWNSLGPLETRRFLSWLHTHSEILRRGSPECGILSGNQGGEPCRQDR